MLLDKIKLTLRIDDDALNDDLQDTINAALKDLELCGIVASKIVDSDPLILRAIKTYCKADFSSDDKESTRYRESYEMIRNHLSMSVDYNTEVVTS